MFIKNLPIILKIILPYTFGVIISFHSSIPNNNSLIISILLILLLLLFIPARSEYTKKYAFSFTFLNFFLVLGLFNGNLNNSTLKNNYFKNGKSNHYLVKVLQTPQIKNNSIKIIAKVLQCEDQKTSGQALLYIEKTERSKQLTYGDELSITGAFKPITQNGNPHEFDYKRFLRIHDIHHQTYLKDEYWTFYKSTFSFFKLLLDLRLYLDSVIEKSLLAEKNKTIAKALLLGEKDKLDKDTLRSYSSAGAMHVLAVSGLHVGIIMLILQFVFKPIKHGKFGLIAYSILILSGLWGYAIITGFTPSVVRAAIMFSFVAIGKELQRDSSSYQSLLVAAFIILILDPLSLFKVGFQLSFLAVLGIVVIQPELYRLFYFKYKILDYIWKITSVSIAAQLATFPLGLYYFHQFPNLFLISNLVVIPLAGLILTLGFIFFIFHFVHPVKIILEQLLNLTFSSLNYCVETIEKIPNSIVWGISISWVETITLYVIIIFSILFFLGKKSIFLIYNLSFLVLFLILLNYKNYNTSNSHELIVYNVKKGFGMDIFQGSKNQFIASKKLLKDDHKLLFHVKHHWFYKNGNEKPSTLILSDTLENSLFKLNNQTFYLITQSIPDPFPEVDYVILEHLEKIDFNLLELWKKLQTQIIIHPNLSLKFRRIIKQHILKENYFDIYEKGAFIYTF